METSVTSRHTLRTILIVCLVGSLIVFGLVSMRRIQSERVPSSDIPLPFGTAKETSVRGQLLDIGVTRDGRTLTDMTFDGGEISEVFGSNNLTFVLTPADPTSFSAGALLSAALTPGTKFYGYKYTSMNAAEERSMRNLKNSSPTDENGVPIPITYSQIFPGTFFASEIDLADAQSFPSQFSVSQGVIFHPLSQVTLDPNSRYLIITETPSAADPSKSDTTMTIRGLASCGDGILQSSEQCDTGVNNKDGSGCSATCQVESGWSCGERTTDTYSATDPQSVCMACTSTDAEHDPYVRGVTVSTLTEGFTFTDIDICSVDSLTQYQCNNGFSEPLDPQTCDNGCEDGACYAIASSPICGNAILEKNQDGSVTETCDRGTVNGTVCSPADGDSSCDWCDSSCHIRVLYRTSCGDGIVQADNGEQCDDGNGDDGDGCSSGTSDGTDLTGCQIETGWTCSGAPSTCSQLISWYNDVQPLDANNDGVVNESDAQAVADYLNAHAGEDIPVDPTVTPVPQYPDVDGDGFVTSSDVLQIEFSFSDLCGNGVTDTSVGEVCDDGTNSGTCDAPYTGSCDACAPDCKSTTHITGPYCGDRIQQIDDGEECDDGNRIDDDTCSNTCQLIDLPF